jgi:hypothetical protein
MIEDFGMDIFSIEVEESRLNAHHQRTGNLFTFRISRHVHKTITPLEPAKDRYSGARGTLEEDEKGENSRQENALQNAEEQDAHRRDHSHTKFHPADLVQMA